MKASDLKRNPVEEAIKEHIARGIPFSECMFRPGSEAFTEFYTRVREMRESLDLDWQDQELLDTDIGECIMVEGERVPLDVPIEEIPDDAVSDSDPFNDVARKEMKQMIATRLNDLAPVERQVVLLRYWEDMSVKEIGEYTGLGTRLAKSNLTKALHKMYKNWGKGKHSVNLRQLIQKEEVDIDEAEYQGRKVKLNSPKRGGPKKFYVYVKNPKTGRVKKISWGDTSGLSVKAKNRGAVRSFVARHKCKQKNDKMKAGYWACRTPRYKALGVKGGAWW